MQNGLHCIEYWTVLKDVRLLIWNCLNFASSNNAKYRSGNWLRLIYSVESWKYLLFWRRNIDWERRSIAKNKKHTNMDLTVLIFTYLLALCTCFEAESKQKPGRGRGSMWWYVISHSKKRSNFKFYCSIKCIIPKVWLLLNDLINQFEIKMSFNW